MPKGPYTLSLYPWPTLVSSAAPASIGSRATLQMGLAEVVYMPKFLPEREVARDNPARRATQREKHPRTFRLRVALPQSPTDNQ